MVPGSLSDSLDLLLNLTLLIALTILSDSLEKRLPKTRRAGVLMQGLLFGAAALLGMLRPLDFGSGLIFDGRSVMVSLCALYFGPWATAVSGFMTIGYRLWIGGSGALVGVLVVLSSALIGLVSRYRLKPDQRPPSACRLYVFGIIVHIVMIALMLTLPKGAGIVVLRRIGLPVMILYPLATILAGKILSDQVKARQAVSALREREERFKLSMEATRDGLWDLDVTTDVAYYNPAYFGILGYENAEFPSTGAFWQTLIHPNDLDRALQTKVDCINGLTDSIDVEYRLRTKSGEWKWVHSRGKCVERDRFGRGIRLVGTHVDITERKEAEERLIRNLTEKEILLSEVHHRVKNNLNIISSLLNLQASTIKTPEQAIAAFQNSCERIIAMSLVHEELYRSRDYAGVDMSTYLDNLTKQLVQAYGPRAGVCLEINAGSVRLSVNASIPCGLILNELITNAFKYAFPDQRSGTIRVSVADCEDGCVEIEASDDGVGMPSRLLEADGEDSGSLGLTLVRLLVEQLDGSLTVELDQGTKFRIRFPRKAPA